DTDLVFTTTSTNLPPTPRDVFRTFDRFATENDFHGGRVGLRGELGNGPLVLRGAATIALGNMHQTTRIDGALATNDFTNFTTVQTFRGGYLAQPTNIGRFSRDTFAVVPELNLSVGWQPRDWLTLTVGYNFLYLSDVLRPGDQIDRTINPTQGPA